jgi:hypothetical protein
MKTRTFCAIAAGCLCIGAHASDTTKPSVLTLAITSPADVDVINAPATFAVHMDISDDSSGIKYANALWRSPSGKQHLEVYDYTEGPIKSGSMDLDTAPLSLYQEPGTWNLERISLCDRAFNCRDYTGSTLTALLSPHTRNVINTRRPDVTPPTASNGLVLTPTVSLASTSAHPRVRLRLDDDIAGVPDATVCMNSPSGTQSLCMFATWTFAPRGSNQYVEGTFYAGPAWETGNWKVTGVNIHDVPGNEHYYGSDAQLDALFPGGRLINVTP